MCLKGIMSINMEEINIKELWDKALVDIELNLSKPNFNTWFKNTNIVEVVDGVVKIGVANEFMREWFLSKYHKLITNLRTQLLSL